MKTGENVSGGKKISLVQENQKSNWGVDISQKEHMRGKRGGEES